MREKVVLGPLEYAHLAVDTASDKLASDIVMLDLQEVSDFADYFVIMTAESSRQMDALSQDLEHALERAGAVRHHREGNQNSGWMLLDFGDVIIHILGPEEREYYKLETAWSRAAEVVRIQ